MLKAIRSMLFYFDRYREDQRHRKAALEDIIRNGWRCPEVVNMQVHKEMKSYRRYTSNAAYHR